MEVSHEKMESHGCCKRRAVGTNLEEKQRYLEEKISNSKELSYLEQATQDQKSTNIPLSKKLPYPSLAERSEPGLQISHGFGELRKLFIVKVPWAI